MEDKLEEVLREFKSLRDRVILQDRRIARLEEQVAKVALWGPERTVSETAKSSIFHITELGVCPSNEAKPTFQDELYICSFFSHTQTHTHSEKEQFLQLIGRRFCWSLNSFYFEIVVRHSCVNFVLTAQRSACSISISIVLLCCQIWIVCFHARLLHCFCLFAPVVHSSHSLVGQRSKSWIVLEFFYDSSWSVFLPTLCSLTSNSFLNVEEILLKIRSAGLQIQHGGRRGHRHGVKLQLPSLVSVGVGKGQPMQLVFHWTPQLQFCAHNKGFTHETVWSSFVSTTTSRRIQAAQWCSGLHPHLSEMTG